MTSRVFGHYELVSLIGVGGMGEVWRAKDTHRDRWVALKLLPEVLSQDKEFLSRFRRESQVAARLREPHVIPIHDYGEIDGRLFIDMRLVDGRDLGDLLKKEGPLRPARAVAVIGQVADALEAAHADNLVHRDVKPSNILVTANDFVYVVDFGIARSIGSTPTSLTVTGATVGTLDYMAPERFTHQPLDGRLDVYSLGCVLAECLTGERPFQGEDLASLLYAHLYIDPPKPSTKVDGIPPGLDDVISRGMAKLPNERFATPRELATAALAALETAPTAFTVARAPETVTFAAPVEQANAGIDRQEERGQEQDAVPQGLDQPLDPWLMELGVLADDGEHRSVDRLPTPPPPSGPRGPVPPRGGDGRDERRSDEGRAGRRRQRKRWPFLAAGLVVALVAGLLVFLLGPSTTEGTPGATAGNTDDPQETSSPGPITPAPTPPSPAASIAVPTIAGDPVPVGQAPGYMQIAPNGRYGYIANREAGVVTVFDTTANIITATIPMEGGAPQFITFSPDGMRAYVTITNTDYTYNTVAFLDTSSNTVTKTVEVGLRPFAPAISSDGRLLYVPLHNEGRVQVIDTTNGQQVASYPVPPNPHWIAISNDGRFGYTANHESGVVSVLDLRENGRVVTTIPTGVAPHSISVSPDGSRVSVVNYESNTASVIDTATNTVVATIEVGDKPQDLTYAPDGRHFYTANVDGNSVSVIDTATNKVTATIGTGNGPTSVAVLPNGRRAYVTNLNDQTVRILDITAA